MYEIRLTRQFIRATKKQDDTVLTQALEEIATNPYTARAGAIFLLMSGQASVLPILFEPNASSIGYARNASRSITRVADL